MLIDSAGALYGRAQNIPVVNTVGAGDAALAGYLAGFAQNRDRTARLHSALLYASSAVGHETTLFEVDSSISDRISVSKYFDSARKLTEPSLVSDSSSTR